MIPSRSQRIAELNDQLRSRIQIPVFGKPQVLGAIYITCSIANLNPIIQAVIVGKIRKFNDFTEDNDPYGEHDFGSLDITDVGKVFWKIDYYADSTYQQGSEDPADPSKSYRVLTIMLADEY